MKIAALALASALAAVVVSAPSFAQNTGQNDQNQHNQGQYNSQDQNDEDHYDQSGMNSQSQNEDTNDESSTTGQNSYGNNQPGQFQDRNNSNNQNWRNNRMGSNGPNWQSGDDRGWRHHDRMGQMWHHRMMMGMMRQQGARFSFSNGAARMNVQCPSNESLQDCVQAAGQLLDKISKSRNNSASGSTNSGSTGGSIPTIPGAVAVPPTVPSPTGH